MKIRKYKHRKTGIIATNEFNCCDGGYYQVDNREIVKSFFIEDSLDWEEIIEYPVGTKVLDTFSNEHKYTYIKQKNGKWALGTQDYFNIDEKSIGENKRFKLTEEVVEKDYEILSFKGNSKTPKQGIAYKSKVNGLFTMNDENNIGSSSEEVMLQSGWDIHSVKRLSDGKVFTVGDFVKETITGQCKGWEIKEFSLKDTRCFSCGVNINNIIKLKEVLFTTEDGVDIFEGDRVYSVTPNFCIVYSGSLKYKPIQLCFSTKEAVEEYILMNKPSLSINDVMIELDKPQSYTYIIKNLKEKIKNV